MLQACATTFQFVCWAIICSSFHVVLDLSSFLCRGDGSSYRVKCVCSCVERACAAAHSFVEWSTLSWDGTSASKATQTSRQKRRYLLVREVRAFGARVNGQVAVFSFLRFVCAVAQPLQALLEAGAHLGRHAEV
jgi:hypothetical protein